jgi:fermentation-respiration switch protein FrsA (DUF1100 family)
VTILCSGQPDNSKWWWIGVILKTRLPVVLKDITWIVTDSAFSTKWLLNDYMRKWTGVILPVKRLPTFVYWVLEDMGVFASEIKTQCRFPSVEKSLRHLETPILIIHGQKDAYVSLQHGRKLFNITRAPKKFLEVPQARHNESVLVSPGLYEKTVVDFLEGVLSGGRSVI